MDLPAGLTVIGVARTGHSELEATPIQAGLNRSERGTVELDPRYQEGLSGLSGFDYAWLLSWLGRPDDPAGPPPLRVVPFLLRQQRREMGVFATRAPRRPSPIGLSLIQMLGISGTVLTFTGVDLLDGTPVLDIKPYVTRFDQPAGEPRCGWFNEVPLNEGATPGQLGPA
jgi:tRNA-Thr(GGU) m(6)t(6)A37 methyltransferase TsaA